MAPIAIIAAVGVGVGAVGAYASYKNQQKMIKEQKKAARYQRQQDRVKAAQERREAIRNARIATGNSAQAAVNQGVESTSASLGALGSIQSQLNQGLSFLDTQNQLSDLASIALGKANKYEQRAVTWGQVSKLGMTVAQNANPIAKQVFGANKGE